MTARTRRAPSAGRVATARGPSLSPFTAGVPRHLSRSLAFPSGTRKPHEGPEPGPVSADGEARLEGRGQDLRKSAVPQTRPNTNDCHNKQTLSGVRQSATGLRQRGRQSLNTGRCSALPAAGSAAWDAGALGNAPAPAIPPRGIRETRRHGTPRKPLAPAFTTAV